MIDGLKNRTILVNSRERIKDVAVFGEEGVDDEEDEEEKEVIKN